MDIKQDHTNSNKTKQNDADNETENKTETETLNMGTPINNENDNDTNNDEYDYTALESEEERDIKAASTNRTINILDYIESKNSGDEEVDKGTENKTTRATPTTIILNTVTTKNRGINDKDDDDNKDTKTPEGMKDTI